MEFLVPDDQVEQKDVEETSSNEGGVIGVKETFKTTRTVLESGLGNYLVESWMLRAAHMRSSVILEVGRLSPLPDSREDDIYTEIKAEDSLIL